MVGTAKTVPDGLMGLPYAGSAVDKFIAFLNAVAGTTGPYLPANTQWQPNTLVNQGQPVTNGGIIYISNSTRTTRATFDATEQAFYTIASGSNQVQPGSNVNMSGTVTVDAAGADFLIYQGTLSAATVHLATTGYLATPNRYTNIWFRLSQDGTGGRNLIFDDTIVWLNGNYSPVIPTPAGATFEFMLYSLDGGTTKLGVVAQPVRTHDIPLGNVLSDGLDSLYGEYFDYDSRIVKVRPSVGGTGTGSVFDLFKGSGQGVSSSIYTTTGNRPSVASGNRTNTATVLPDTVLIAPGDYLRGKTITAAGATFGMLQVKTIEANV